MKTKYVALCYRDCIVEREIERETKIFVFFKDGTRQSKASIYEVFFDTWAEAHGSLMQARTEEVDAARLMLEYRLEKLEQIQKMEEPG